MNSVCVGGVNARTLEIGDTFVAYCCQQAAHKVIIFCERNVTTNVISLLTVLGVHHTMVGSIVSIQTVELGLVYCWQADFREFTKI